PRLFSATDAEREAERLAQAGARHLFLGDVDYPPLLAETEFAPPVLTIIGDPGLARKPTIAMVGARNASAAACRFARSLAQDLGASGVVVVSGLSRGIDMAEHGGSLSSGTSAGVAGGVDRRYPPENEARQRLIAEKGLVVAEQP